MLDCLATDFASSTTSFDAGKWTERLVARLLLWKVRPILRVRISGGRPVSVLESVHRPCTCFACFACSQLWQAVLRLKCVLVVHVIAPF